MFGKKNKIEKKNFIPKNDYEKAKQQIPGFEEVYGSNDLSMKNREAELIKQGFVEQK